MINRDKEMSEGERERENHKEAVSGVDRNIPLHKNIETELL
mgnify:CR=1 FL=1